MAIFKAVVRRPRKDGFWQVYIRVGVGVKVGYIATDKYVTSKELSMFTFNRVQGVTV